MTTPVHLSPHETKVLSVLAACYLDEDCCVLYYATICERSGLTLRQARRATRSLARKGLVEHTIAWDLDLRPRGSGYMCLPAGKARNDA